MRSLHDPARRSLLADAAAAVPAGLLAAVISGCQNAPAYDRRLLFRSLDEALREPDRLAHAEALAPARWSQPLRPLLAYGQLSRSETAQAHAMHLANHFSAFRAQV